MSDGINESLRQDPVPPGSGNSINTPADNRDDRNRGQADSATFAETPLLDQHIARNDYPPQSPYEVELPISGRSVTG